MNPWLSAPFAFELGDSVDRDDSEHDVLVAMAAKRHWLLTAIVPMSFESLPEADLPIYIRVPGTIYGDLRAIRYMDGI